MSTINTVTVAPATVAANAQFDRIMRSTEDKDVLEYWTSAIGAAADEIADAVGEQKLAQLQARVDEIRAKQAAMAAKKAEGQAMSPRQWAVGKLTALGLEAYAAAARGEGAAVARAEVLISALYDQRVPSVLKMKPDGFIRRQIGVAKKAASVEAEEEREKLLHKDWDDARRQIASFEAHKKVGNVGGMTAAMRALRQAQVQHALVGHLGGVSARNLLLANMQGDVDEAMKAKIGRPADNVARHARQAERAAACQAMRGYNETPAKHGKKKR